MVNYKSTFDAQRYLLYNHFMNLERRIMLNLKEEAESAVVGLVCTGRLMQSVLRSAFKGKL